MTTARATESSTSPLSSQRKAAIASLLLGFAGLVYWVPAISDPMKPVGGSPTIVHRVASMALEQYPPAMRPAVPILGALFCLASLLQIPAAASALLRRPPALGWLRALSYCKLALYITSGLLLGLAVFSSIPAGPPSWLFSGANWLANLAMVGIYYWIIASLQAPDDEMDLAPPEEEEGQEEEPEPDARAER